jgi:hypothetical protein
MRRIVLVRGAAGIVGAALRRPDGPTGGFFHNGRLLPW